MATRFVRCIDNTLVADILVVGEKYEVMHINERDGYYVLSGLGRFTMTRFEVVSAAAIEPARAQQGFSRAKVKRASRRPA